MKTKFILVCSLAAIAAFGFAQSGKPTTPSKGEMRGGPGGMGGPGGPGGRFDPKEMIARMEKREDGWFDQIKVNASQKAKIKKLRADRDAKRMKLFSSIKPGQMPDRDKMKAESDKIRDAWDAGLSKILTKEQMAKFKELREKDRGRMRGESRGRPNGPRT